MMVGTWLDVIRARVAARGVPLADIARAAGMERSNLRRLLSSADATPRLGTVMRVLAALDLWVMPPGARTARELMTFVDGERDRLGASWDALLVGTRFAVATFALQLRESPERLPLDVVLHVAGHLESALKIDEVRDSVASHDDGSRRRTPGRGVSRAPRSRSLASSSPPSKSEGPEPVVAAACQVDAPPRLSTSSPWRLCPPRLGRYRDSPPAPPAPRASAVAPYVPPEPTYALEHAVLHELGDLSRNAWRDLYCALHETVTGALEAPLDVIDELAVRTERWFRRLRRPAGSEPEPEPRPKVPFADMDPLPFIEAWRAMKSNPERETTRTFHDSAGRAHVIHPAVSGAHTVDILLGQGGRPNRLAAVFDLASADTQVLARPDLPLVLRVGDAVHPFTHVHAGPVFGVLHLGERNYMLGAMSSMIALVEVTKSRARAVWACPAEDLEATPLEVEAVEAADEPKLDPPVTTRDAPAPGGGVAGAEPGEAPQKPSFAAELATIRRALDEERGRADAARQRAERAEAALASSERARQDLRHQLEAELVAVRVALEDERGHRVADRQRVDAAEAERMVVQGQLDAERSARGERERAVETSVRELFQLTLSTMRELTAVRRRLRDAEQALQSAAEQRQAVEPAAATVSLSDQQHQGGAEPSRREGVQLDEASTHRGGDAPPAHPPEQAAADSASNGEAEQPGESVTPPHASAIDHETVGPAASRGDIAAERPGEREATNLEAERAGGSGVAPAEIESSPTLRVVVLNAQDEILADFMVSEEDLGHTVSAWMHDAPGCDVYVDGYLISDEVRARMAEHAIEPRGVDAATRLDGPTTGTSMLDSDTRPTTPKPRVARRLSKKWRR